MKLVCISDTHGDHEQVTLPDGDILIHAGDLTGHGNEKETQDVMQWLGRQAFRHCVCIAGNHDLFMEKNPAKAQEFAREAGVILLNDSGVELDGVSFWGSPITPRFFNWAFMRDAGAAIEVHWKLIPKYTDVLITHGPPYGILDQVPRGGQRFEHVGCPSLLETTQQIRPKVHIFGHIHEGHGHVDTCGVAYHNASIMNEAYRIAHKPVVIGLNVE